MTDQVTDTVVQDELTTLKARADRMGISYHPSIGVEKLREKINEVVAAQDEPAKDEALAPSAESPSQRRSRIRQEATKLVRIRVTCMNPIKKEWEGEIFTVSNAVVGTLKKYVPFNADEGWHVPQMILNQIQQRKCQVFHTVRDERGNKSRQGKLIREFAVEILDPLSPKELQELAQRQAMAAGQ
ncbi:hypothetical protein [Vreelandella venusta]|uniref:hypothetical protein n=1 Tax=Vreelandella venusta TaxID=44935 RepID=UPI0011714974|nr:hypothetical protein [Halomonas venusta]GEK52351.1 hypothetical protein HVE01_30720 [Halomonas venusta]